MTVRLEFKLLIKNLIKRGVSNFLSGNDKGTSIDKFRANFDIGVPISQMASFVHTVEFELVESFKNLQLCTFGHMADGNLHIIAWTGREDDVDSIYERVYTLVGTVGGTITAEHGIGTMKRQYLSLCRSEQEIDLMRALKKAMDPNNILNPGRVI